MPRSNRTTKMLGDAGEHYALARFAFAGIPCAKMPDNWPEYDLVAEVEGKIQRITVKTRSETASFSKSSWFAVNADSEWDWKVCLICFATGEVSGWVIPRIEALTRSTGAKNSHQHLSWRQLEETDMQKYRENWDLTHR